jgi:hypothetical protein
MMNGLLEAARIDDLPESSQSRVQISNLDDPTAASVVQLVRDLPGRVSAEDDLLAELATKTLEASSIAS